jgi:hypothetical protein
LSVNCGMFVVVSRYFLFPPPIKLTSAKWLKYCFLCVCLRMVMSIILSYQMFIRSEFRVVMSATMFRSSLSPVVWGLVSYLHYLCLFAYSGVQHILRCGFFFFVFVLCLVYPMLPVSLDCSFLIASSVFSNGYFLKLKNGILNDQGENVWHVLITSTPVDIDFL